jgi:uncharacterized protein (DUF2141 family)
MKKIFSCCLLLLVVTAAGAQGKIVVQITNLVNNKGVCKTCLFNNAASFAGKGPALKCINVAVKNKTGSVAFNDVVQGTYAIAVFHDENKNDKMDTNFLGIPKEGYGASKNKLPFASAPTFADNKFDVGANSTINIEIRLRNL